MSAEAALSEPTTNWWLSRSAGTALRSPLATVRQSANAGGGVSAIAHYAPDVSPELRARSDLCIIRLKRG